MLLNGGDLTSILEGRYDLTDALQAKVRQRRCKAIHTYRGTVFEQRQRVGKPAAAACRLDCAMMGKWGRGSSGLGASRHCQPRAETSGAA